MRSLRKLDIFPKFDSKFEQDAREKTVIGALFSLVALTVIVFLVVSELRYFFSVQQQHELFVDTDVGGDLDITINITFPVVPCDLITIDAVDSFGEFQDDMDKKTVKHRVDGETMRLIEEAQHLVDSKKVATTPTNERGEPKADCMSCYGAELHPGQCCNTCAEVQQAYQARGWHFELRDVSVVQCSKERLQQSLALAHHEGCNVYSHFRVSRVQGNIHFIPGKAFTIMGQHLHDIGGEEIQRLNLSHVIHTLQFGASFPGQMNPLDGRSNVIIADDSEEEEQKGNGEAAADATKDSEKKNQPQQQRTPVSVNGKFSYFVKVVPTLYEQFQPALSSSSSSFETNQYSVTEHYSERPASQQGLPLMQQQFIPGVFILYDLSPIKVRIFQARPYPSVVHFVLQLCAVCGGVFTVMGLVDAFLHHGVIQAKRKLAINKLS